MKNMLHRLFLMTMISSLSVFAYAVPENNSILRLESKDGDDVVYAVAQTDGSVVPMTETALTAYGLEYALWIVEVTGNSTFKLKNLGTGKYLNYREEGGLFSAKKVYLNVKDPGVSIYEDDKHRYYFKHRSTLSTSDLLIQYDPNTEYWMYYKINGTNKNNSQSSGNWSDDTNPPSNEDTSMEIPGTIVNQMFGGGDITTENLDNIKNAVESGDLMETLEKDPVSIVVGDDTTYPEATSGFWKTATIQLNVNSSDWTPVSFPVDVTCVTKDLSDVGYQYYNSQARADNGKDGWVTVENVTASTVFNQGVAYHFATNSKTMTLEFEPVSKTTLTTIENSVNKTLVSTGGDAVNANWYYIGNALFKDANMSQITKISRYNKTTRKWEPKDVTGTLDPFDAFFVQYEGSYTMSSSAARSSAPMLAREKSATEKYYLRIEGEGEEDQTGIFFEEDASAEGYVIGEDFLSFATKGRSFTEIYTYEEDIEFSFNTRPMENTFVKVGLYVGKAGRYTISLDNISGNAESMVLYDNYEQDFARLHLGETYTFDSERGSFDDRFAVAVTYAPGTTTDNVSLEAVNLVVVGNEIQGVVEGADYAIYNSTGSLVYSDVAYAETVTLPNLTSGVYIVRTATGWTKFVVK